jgi:hypothetical protein
LDYAAIFEKFKKEAKARQIEGGKNKVRQKIAEPKKDDNKTDSKVAKLLGTNRTYIQKARKIKDENPERFEKIKSGKEKISNIREEIFADENDWHTPEEYIEKVKTVLGSIDVDPASSEIVQDGLDKIWNGSVYLNPPCSTAKVNAFIDKFIEEYNSGHLTQAIILTNSSTHEDWFHKLMKIAQLACFADKRVRLYHKGKKAKITHGQVFFYVGSNEKKFIEEFTDVGLVMRKA